MGESRFVSPVEEMEGFGRGCDEAESLKDGGLGK